MENEFVVMVVDDDPDEHFIMGVALSSIDKNITVLDCYSVDKAMQHLDMMMVLPDLIIIDLNLPGKDGIGMLCELNFRDDYRHIPTLIYSGFISESNFKKATEHGAHFFLEKTPDLVELSKSLQQKISSLLNP